jgi:hypothetical protein
VAEFIWAKGAQGTQEQILPPVDVPAAPLVLVALICWPSQFEAHPPACDSPGWTPLGGRSHLSVWAFPEGNTEVAFSAPSGEPNQTWVLIVAGYRARGIADYDFAKSCQRPGDPECDAGDYCPSTGVMAPGVFVPERGLAVGIWTCHDEGGVLNTPEGWSHRFEQSVPGDPGGSLMLLADVAVPGMVPDTLSEPSGTGWQRGIGAMVGIR